MIIRVITIFVENLIIILGDKEDMYINKINIPPIKIKNKI